MRTGFAFEFLGRMSEMSSGSSVSHDDLGELFSASLGLIDSVGSIVNLWEQKKTTRLLQATYNSRVFKDYIAKCEKNSQKEVAEAEKVEREIHQMNLASMRSEANELICNARNELRQKQEQHRRAVENKIYDAQYRTSAATYDAQQMQAIHNLFYDIITLANEVLEGLRENQSNNIMQIRTFEEQIRKSFTLLQRSFKGVV